MLGDRLVNLRKMKGMTQKEVANDLKISRGTYAHYEINRREPDISTLQRLADYFDVTVDYLLNSTPDIKLKVNEPAQVYSIFDVDRILEDARTALKKAIEDGLITEEKAAEAVELARRQLMLFLEQKK